MQRATSGSVWRQRLEQLMSIGAHPEESEIQRGGRRVFIVAFVAASAFSTIPIAADFSAGYTWVAAMNAVLLAAPVGILFAMWRWPRRFRGLVSVLFTLITIGLVVETAMFGGLLGSGLTPIFGIVVALSALLAAGTRAAIAWLGVFVATVVFSLVVDRWVDPLYVLADPVGDAALNLVATGVVTMAIVVYFVRQRDHFQRRSDDLLHNILPAVIAARLKDASGTIADDAAEASVLFADVVGFTPMSATMTPAELVDLLDEVFSTFDGFVAELGLEKIKTVGDAYMVAAGVPEPRADHAEAIAELALRIRDHVASVAINGRRLTMRIGIDSGPLTAGVIGTHRFAYDLWGDTVNTASRMEAGAPPGAIQITPATFSLLRDRYACEPRGTIEVKGKGAMETYLLVSRRPQELVPSG